MKDSKKQKKKNKEENILAPLLLLTVLFIILASLFIFNKDLQRQILSKQTRANPLSSNFLSAYPALKNPISPLLFAQAALIMDDESKVVLFAKNEKLRFSMASTVKIMTALVALL
ncbi:MAG: hypothetical protein HYU49_01845 [Candidatus Levybacteria bacterium]|nr:hypothetical protein [Candidatus Levybacteria bacterium]